MDPLLRLGVRHGLLLPVFYVHESILRPHDVMPSAVSLDHSSVDSSFTTCIEPANHPADYVPANLTMN